MQIQYIVEMATRRATRTVIWDAGMLVEHMVFKVILSQSVLLLLQL